MKVVIFSYIILALVITLVIVNSIIISHNIDVIIEKLKSIPSIASSKDDYNDVFEDYMKIQHFLAITVSHDDLTNIEDNFYEILGATDADDDQALNIAKSRLIGALTHLKRLVGINLDSILLNFDSITRIKSYFLYTRLYA